MAYLRGRVEHVLYSRDTYYVLSFQVIESDGLGREASTKVSGHFFGLKICTGATFQIDGEWKKHPKYGKQFSANGWAAWARSPQDVTRFFVDCVELSADRKLIKKIVSTFGLATFDALLGDQLEEIASDEAERLELRVVKDRWKIVRGIATLADFLREYQLGASVVSAVFQRFGYDAISMISDNPYNLLEVEGFSFGRADKLAFRRGIQLDDQRRLVGATLWVIRNQIRQQGHLYLRRGDLSPLVEDLVADEQAPAFSSSGLDSRVLAAVATLVESGSVKLDPDAGVYPPDLYHYERGAAELLSRFLTPAELVLDLNEFLATYESANGITLSDMQREAVVKLIANRVLVVTGAPGTGKTTLIRTFVQLFNNLNVSFQLMAPTGIAAKRLASVTESGAQTIHRALKYDGFSWGLGGDAKLNTQAVIVDECSMVDQELFFRLLDALEPTTMLVIVGDDAQLPSVGAGNVLRELLACSEVQHVRLEHIFRQAETSDIVLAAHSIRKGQSPLTISSKAETEFQFVRVFDENTIADLIVKMAEKLKARDANFQVLSPKYEGTVGVDNLNNLLRDRLNPESGQGSWDDPGFNFNVRVGDRVMVVKNNYKLNIYNGDIGKVLSIEQDHLKIRVHGVGKTLDADVNIPKEIASLTLKLAYAVTVHRCQGEEFETVILPLVKSHGRMLQRNLFYTAITRARKKVWLLGDPEAVLKAVANDKVVQRNTVFRSLIKHVRPEERASSIGSPVLE